MRPAKNAMSHSYSQCFVHLVWSTRRRKNIIPQQLLVPLWEYFIGVGYNKDTRVVAAGGMPNHVHLAIELMPTTRLSDAISAFKANSSRWLKEQGVRQFVWQRGYGAFSVSVGNLEQVKRYIQNQAKHHKKITYEEEFLDMLRRARVEFDPNDLFD